MRISSRQSIRPARLVTRVGWALVIAVAGTLLLAATAGADAITPESGPTQNAKDIDSLFKIVLLIGVAVVGVIWILLFTSLARFRGDRDGSAAQIRGNTALELGWTAAPILVVVAVIALTLVMLPDIKNPAKSGPDSVADAHTKYATVDQPPPPDGKALEINVSGQRFIWRYQYPNGAVAFHDLVVPKDTTVILNVKTIDVAHSWWIPELGGQVETLPGKPNKTWFKATETGEFEGQNAEFDGANSAFMTARVIVMEPTDYEAWLSQQQADIAEAKTEQAKQSKQFAREGD